MVAAEDSGQSHTVKYLSEVTTPPKLRANSLSMVPKSSVTAQVYENDWTYISDTLDNVLRPGS